MKKLSLAITALLLLVMAAAFGCGDQETTGTVPEDEMPVVSTCVTCHTDKDILKEVASPVVEEAVSEATVGEG